MQPEDYTELRPLVKRAVDAAMEEYGKFAERADFEAECWVTVYSYKADFQKRLNSGDIAGMVGHLTSAAMRFGIAEKAVQNGYSVEDMEEYPPAMLRHLLPDVFEVEDWQSFSSNWDPMPRSKGLANATGDRLAHIIDIRSALPSLTQKQYDALMWRYKMGYTYPLIGGELGISEEAAKDRVRKAIRSLSKTLRRGNPSDAPKSRPRPTEGRREVHSNSTWRAKAEI